MAGEIHYWLHGREHKAKVTLAASRKWKKLTGRNLQADLFRFLSAIENTKIDNDKVKNVYDQYLVLYDVMSLELAQKMLYVLSYEHSPNISEKEIEDAFFQTQQINLPIFLADPNLSERNAPWPYLFVHIATQNWLGETDKKKVTTNQQVKQNA